MSIQRPRRRLGVLSTVVGAAAMLGLAVVAAPATPAAATPLAAAAAGGPVTVPAPGAGPNATVTVSKTTDLGNQTIRVSWTGFRPSSATRLQNSGDSLDVNTEDPVRVYECRGVDPASSSDCYGSPGFRGVDATDTSPAVPPVPAFTYPGQTDPYDATPDGPANWQDNVTGPNGKGQVTIQVYTKRESAGLGCDKGSPCSIVVVPNYGRPQGDTEDLMDAPWAWARRTVVPLTFLPVDDACSLGQTSLGVEGSPMAADLMATWRARTCTLSGHAVNLDYTSIGEPQTRGDVASGTTDVGLVIDPLDADAAAGAGVVYSPVSVTGLVVAFQVDDANGRPVTSMKLDARLVAKLITASYRSGGDPAVINNPVNIFHDPEFLQLNPGVHWPSGAPGNHVLLLGDLSDTTEALTRWIWSDPAARAFLQGKPDPWGMTVNSNYKNIAMPSSGFPLLDQNLSSTFQPIQGMDAVSRQLSIAQFPGAFVSVVDGQTVTTKPPRQNPGAREVIGIIDAADAARYLLPTAALQNASGAFVKPSTASFDAAMAHAHVNPDGVTRSVDLTNKNPHTYPLTTLVSAALSTQADKATRTRMADFLDYVSGAGQVPGDRIGQLPAGHAPLTKDMLSEVAAAKAAVLAGPKHEPSPSPSPSGQPSPSSSSGGHVPAVPGVAPGAGPGGTAPLPGGAPGGTVVAPSDAPSATQSAQADAAPAMTRVSAQTNTARQLVLPALLVLAMIGVAAGPVLLYLDRTGQGPSWLRR
jgi:hypothetical protein